ncbi:hypothetical protein AJ79_04526 [Helicocarpus griseus UAMH5409]|uniref:Neutral protease 2 n=1 Tax=Helicocarpus griseus UAMH5409 TaxID=1447875 RepID=A0A2B7XU54_9EURO|nr:hypothetical protein AJ79_04526 [Helicocarpus griseus UAMH5409]
MRSLSSILAVAAFTASALAGVMPPASRRAEDSPELDVQLTQVDGTTVKAIVTNKGDKELNILNLNFFKDAAPVKKVAVYNQGVEVPFGGIRIRHRTKGLTAEAFTHLAPGESFEDEFDVAYTADLSQGGRMLVKAQGFVSTSDANGDLDGVVRYGSNDLEFDVDGPAAAKSFAAMNHMVKRTRLASCSGSNGSATRAALRDCSTLASRAASEAAAGGARLQEYFKSTSQSTRNTVSARFRAIASESSSETSGRTTYYCNDPYGICSSNVLAYTIPAQNVISNCPIYYTVLDHASSVCHDQDRVTTTLHEFTHAPGVYSPGTDDHAYGYAACMRLSTSQALNNADSFALFAQGKLTMSMFPRAAQMLTLFIAIYAGC